MSRESQDPAARHRARTRRHDIWGGIGIVAGAAVFVAALEVPLDDPALVISLKLGLRGSRAILDV